MVKLRVVTLAVPMLEVVAVLEVKFGVVVTEIVEPFKTMFEPADRAFCLLFQVEALAIMASVTEFDGKLRAPLT